MGDLIDRQEAIETVRKCAVKEVTPAYMLIDKAEVMTDLMLLPSAQHKIIHCENCEHWKNNHLCECLSRYGTFETPKDFFCGYGKAK